jgi:hypothetical protein
MGKTKNLVAVVVLVAAIGGVVAADRTADDAGRPSPDGPDVEFRDSDAMFTVWAWISVACSPDGSEVEWPPAKRYVREALLERLDADLLADLRAEFERRDDRMFGYWASIWPIFLTPPPEMSVDLAGLSAPGEVDSRALAATRRRFTEMADLLPLLNRFWREADIGGLRRECDRWYEPAIACYRDGTAESVESALAYLKTGPAADVFPGPVVMFTNLIGEPGAAMGPSFAGVKYDVECPHAGVESIVITPHEYIHDMVAGQTRAESNRERIESLVAAVAERRAGTPAGEHYPDPVDWFDECLVRSLDFTIRMGWRTAEEREELERALEYQAGRGFVLAVPMRASLTAYERSEGTFDQWFPRLMNDLEAAVGQ